MCTQPSSVSVSCVSSRNTVVPPGAVIKMVGVAQCFQNLETRVGRCIHVSVVWAPLVEQAISDPPPGLPKLHTTFTVVNTAVKIPSHTTTGTHLRSGVNCFLNPFRH